MADFGAYGYPSMMPPAKKPGSRPTPVGPPVRQAGAGAPKPAPAYGGGGAPPFGPPKPRQTQIPPTMPGKPLPAGDPMAQSAGMKVPGMVGPPIASAPPKAPGPVAPPFQPPGMGGTAGRGPLGPPIPQPQPPLPAPKVQPELPGAPGWGSGRGMAPEGGGWVDAGYGTGPLNAQGLQWRPFDFAG